MDILVKDYQINADKCADEIQRNRFNDMTTTYYLLFKKKERAAIFRQAYNEDVKKLLRRKKQPEAQEASPKKAEVEPEVTSNQKSPVTVT